MKKNRIFASSSEDKSILKIIRKKLLKFSLNSDFYVRYF